MQTHAEEPAPPPRLNPWLFVPLLYFMQAIPVTVVQELSTIFYKDLGIANEAIVRWTSLISLPWSLQLLLGPLVDLNGTKRRWILGGQLLISFGLIATAFLLRVPFAFEITLVILGATAVTSALCNIATDGFYIISMAKDQQAKFVGVQTTCYRLGRLFCTGLLVLFVGLLTRFEPLDVQASGDALFALKKDGVATTAREIRLTIQEGLVKTTDGATVLGAAQAGKDGKTTNEIAAPAGVFGLSVSPDGTLTAQRVTGTERIGQLAVGEDLAAPAGLSATGGRPGMNPALAWTAVLLCTSGIFFFGSLVNRRALPRPAEDAPAVASEPNATARNILRTLVLIALGVGGYFLLNAFVRVLAHGMYSAFQGKIGFDMTGWRLPEQGKVIGYDLGLGGFYTEWYQLGICAVVVFIALRAAKRLIGGTPMGEALSSFVRQPGIVPIFFFILFYRFGEAMVSKMSPLFLKDSLANGGLAIGNEQLGVIKGLAGVVGIICGGLAGGWLVGKLGLRRAFLPLAIAMHLPNLLYLWASTHTMPMAHADLPIVGRLNVTLAGVDFVDQFGYGFGFAAYMVYIMWVAQRGRFKTSHYAIGTGMGALCIAIAGVLSGVLQSNFGYTGFFTWVIFLSLPGLVTLLFIPLEEGR